MGTASGEESWGLRGNGVQKRQEFMDWEGFRGGDEAWKIMSTSLVAERRKHAQQLKGEGPEGLTKTEKAE